MEDTVRSSMAGALQLRIDRNPPRREPREDAGEGARDRSVGLGMTGELAVDVEGSSV